jgi:hypothetical protein
MSQRDIDRAGDRAAAKRAWPLSGGRGTDASNRARPDPDPGSVPGLPTFKNEVAELPRALPSKPQVLWMTPKCIEHIFNNLRKLGEVTGRSGRADELIVASRKWLECVASVTRKISKRQRVFCMEWRDPVDCSGHWVPEMVEIAGGGTSFGKGEPTLYAFRGNRLCIGHLKS